MKGKSMRKVYHRRSGLSLVEILVAIAIVAVLSALGFAFAGKGVERASGIVCLNNLKQLGFAFRHYALDNDGFLPIRSEPVNTSNALQWHREVWPYLAVETTPNWGTARDQAKKTDYHQWAFHCPLDRQANSTLPGLSYAANELLVDIRLQDISPKTVILTDFVGRYVFNGNPVQLEMRLPARHHQSDYFLFADNHVERFTLAQLPLLQEKPAFWRGRE